MLKRAGLGLSTILAISLASIVSSHVFAEEKQPIEQEPKKSSLVEKVVGIQEAQAMPVVPVPAPPTPQTALKEPDMNSSFKNYMNDVSDSRYARKEPARENFEEVAVYRAYYYVDDKKDQVEEKVMAKVNKSKWKDKIGIDKISTRFRDDNLKLQVRLKEQRNKQRMIIIQKNYQDEAIEAKYTVKF